MKSISKRALISVSDKAGAAEFAKGLAALGYEIISTGGTADALAKAGVKVIPITDITGFPECLDGRVKTIHPAVHAGLLAMRDNPSHMARLRELNINTIDVVAVNLYPFAATVKKPGVTMEEAIENIDIGGPSMLRSAAKNAKDVLVVVEPADYAEALERLQSGTDDLAFRLGLMRKVYRHTAVYDTMIADYLEGRAACAAGNADGRSDYEFPRAVSKAFNKVQDLRYGENPHQKAAFYADAGGAEGTLAAAEQLWGKELSFLNISDASAAIGLVREFKEPAAVAVKHETPCGVALGKDIFEAYLKAYECDPKSIYGGIVALNREVDAKTAAEMVKIFLEIVIAPSFSDAALEILKSKQNLRIMRLKGLDASLKPYLDYKRVEGGLLIQERDNMVFDPAMLKPATKKTPSTEELRQLEFAYTVVKHVKSNAIVICRDFAAVGIAGGQTNRIWAAKQAIERADERCKGAVAASDAYFPFADSVTALCDAGVTAIVQPGGSVRDAESVEVCDKSGAAMVFTGVRHFKH